MSYHIFKDFFYLILFLVMIMPTGCAIHKPLVMETPPWYQQESGAHYAEGGNRVFYGIGKAEGSNNATLLRATAANRARKEMAKVLDHYVTELFQNSGVMPALTMEEGEQVIGALVRNAVKQSVINDQWRDEGQPHLYILCQIDLDTFKKVLANYSAIDVKERTAMMAETEKVHTLLAGEPHRP